MSKRNLYFRSVYKSTQAIEDAALGSALRILSFPRGLLEVFIRRDMGERFFSFGRSILMFFVLAYIPYGYRLELENISLLIGLNGPSFTSSELRNMMIEPGRFYEFDWPTFLLHNTTWYIFLIAFLYVSIQRKNEIKRLPSVFDLGRSSIDPGKYHPAIGNFKWYGRRFDIRGIETILEPLLFFLIGLVLVFFKQTVGYLLLLSSIGYWLNYRLAYLQGDQIIMDTIDEMLFSQERANAFIEDKDPENSNGVRYYGRKPVDPEARRKLAEMFESEEFVEIK